MNQTLKGNLIKLLWMGIGFTGVCCFIYLETNKSTSKPEYHFDQSKLSFEYSTDTKKYNFEHNQFEQYYMEDTIVINDIFNQTEKNNLKHK